MKTFLILILVHYVIFFIKKKKNNYNNTLCCGLIGFVGANPSDFNKDKFDKLGMYNVSRGEHSCGISVDGVLYKGVHQQSKYSDFISNTIIPSPKESSVVIGHTRHATVGAKTKDNAHPFRFDYSEGYFIGAHNGTLINHKELAKKYGIKGNKIDSQILLEIISKCDDNINVLSEYYGAAALLMHSSINPNTLYLFRGESKQNNSTVETEERPLFYWQQSETSMYISSLKNSLYAIMDCEEDKNNIFEVQTNCVYEITNGKIVKKAIIDRSKTREMYYKNLNTNSSHNNNVNHTTNNNRRYNARNNNVNNNVQESYKINNIFYEKDIMNSQTNGVTFSQLRFKQDGKLTTGIYIYIQDVGYVKLCKELKDINKELLNYSYIDNSIPNKPEMINFGNIINKVTLFYIYEGVMLEYPEDYSICLEPSIVRKSKIGFKDLSEMSKYPIIDLNRLVNDTTIIPKVSQDITLKRKDYYGVINVPGTFVQYSVNNGILNYSTIKSKCITHDSKTKILDLYTYIDDENEEDDVDDISFENNVQDLLNLDNINELDNMIGIINYYDEAIAKSESLVDSESKIAIMLLEASKTIKETLEPISNVVATAYNSSNIQ